MDLLMNKIPFASNIEPLTSKLLQIQKEYDIYIEKGDSYFMSKEEARNMKRATGSSAGNAKREIMELERLQEAEQRGDSEITTITAGCTTFLSLICC